MEIKKEGAVEPALEGAERPPSWWPELVELVEHVEAEAARREGRPARPAAEICAAIEREWFWRLWRSRGR